MKKDTMAENNNQDTHVRDASEEEEEEDTSVEIQRSFLVPVDFEMRLKPYGARLLADEAFVDEFYDREDYALSLQDISLRARNGEWELTYREPKEDSKVPQRVLRGPEEISAFLHSRKFLNGHGTGNNVKDALKHAGFVVFASPSVSRKVYGIPGQNLQENGDLLPAKISFDTSDLGYSVGEIEVSVDHREEIPAALKTIEVLSQRLGFESVAASPRILDS